MSADSLRVVLVLKTAEGALWTVPHVDRLRRRGHHVVAVLPAQSGRLRDALERRGVPVLESAFDFRFRPVLGALRGLWRLRRQLRDQRPDVVFYHLYASALASRFAAFGTRPARVHMVAGPLHLDSPVLRLLERFLARLDHVLICGSAHTAIRYRRLGLSLDRTPTIPYGVDINHLYVPTPAQRAQARADLGVGPSTFVVTLIAYVYAPRRRMYAGRGIKGHDVLLQAWQRFAPTHPQARLVLVGGGRDPDAARYQAELMRRFAVEGDPTVNWLSTVDDVRRYYCAADVSVSPSLSENHGAALEAGGMGVPSIVSDAGGLPETVEPRSGWMVPRDDVAALVRALEHAYAEFVAGTLTNRGARAREWVVTRFNQAGCTELVVGVIERTAATRPAPTQPGPHTRREVTTADDGPWVDLDPAT